MLFIVYIVLLKTFHSYISVWFTTIVVYIVVNILIVLLIVYILYYYFTINFSKNYFLCDIWSYLTLLVDYSSSPTLSIHTLAKFIYYYLLCWRYCLYSYYFLYNYEKLTFLWHLIISNCCCLLRIKFYLNLSFLYFCLICYHCC